MYKYITTIYDRPHKSWDVYGIENDPVYENDYVAVTGPLLFLTDLYRESKKPGFMCDVKTDFYRCIDLWQAETLEKLETLILDDPFDVFGAM